MGDKDERAARLAEALRANLRRRKAQARALTETEFEPEVSGDQPPTAQEPTE
jgi:hypothetical protein